MNSYFLALPTLKYVVVIPFVSDYSMNLTEIPNRFERNPFLTFCSRKFNFSLSIDDFLSLPGENIPLLEFEQVPFNHPLFIISLHYFYKFL